MRKYGAVIAVIGVLLSNLSAEEISNDSKKIKKWVSVNKDDLKTFPDEVSYALGYNIAKQILDVPEQFGPIAGGKIKQELLMAGIIQSVLDKSLIDDRKLAEIMDIFQKRSQALEERTDAITSNAPDADEEFVVPDQSGDWKDFFEGNQKKDGVVQTTSGLQYKIIKDGSGDKPVVADTVSVHYTGRLQSGQVFDSSVDRGEPTTFPLNGVIPGWTEGLQLMNVGSKYRLFIPPHLGYGQDGAGGLIPPNAVLIFDVELISIEK